jgi:hypothetical protein
MDLGDIGTEIATLDEENGKRFADLAAGRYGPPVQLQPGTFELLKLTVYVERILEHLGSDLLDQAKLDFANHVSEALDKLEEASRRAKFTQGLNGNRG